MSALDQYELPIEGTYRSPLVIVVPEKPNAETVNYRSASFLGSIATGSQIEIEQSLRENTPEGEYSCLMDAVRHASWGDPVARAFVESSVSTDILERAIKKGYIKTVELSIANGRVVQHGQTNEGIQRATHTFNNVIEMRPRSEAELRNKFRIDDALEEGDLKDYYFVVWSAHPLEEEVDEELADEIGFFGLTKSCSIQATTLGESGKLILESAFVSGVYSPGGERHDLETIIKLAAELGVDYSGMTTAEIIDTPLFIHKSLMPNGVIDLVKRYDVHAGGTFFGESKPQEDYLEYVKKWQAWEKELKPIANAIVNELIDSAYKLKTPLQATAMLAKLSQKYMVDRSIVDETVDPRVFGEEAAGYIEIARIHHERGSIELAEAARNKAQAKAKSHSCPSAIREDENGESGTEESNETDSTSAETRCPKCHKKVSMKEAKKIEGYLCCPKCHYAVEICTNKDATNKLESKINEAKIDTVAEIIELFKPKITALLEEPQAA